MLDAKIASALNKITQNSQFKKKVSLAGQKAQKEDQFLQLKTMIRSFDYEILTPEMRELREGQWLRVAVLKEGKEFAGNE